MSQFLDNLKHTLENGEFNSEAVKKINQVGAMADNVLAESKGNDGFVDTNILSDKLRKRIEEVGYANALPEDGALANGEYEKSILLNQEIDKALNTTATLLDMEQMVSDAINDMTAHIYVIEDALDLTNPNFKELADTIQGIKEKYGSLILSKEEISNMEIVTFIKPDSNDILNDSFDESHRK